MKTIIKNLYEKVNIFKTKDWEQVAERKVHYNYGWIDFIASLLPDKEEHMDAIVVTILGLAIIFIIFAIIIVLI